MKTKTKALKLGFNALGFQAAWWISVLGVMLEWPFLGPAVMAGYLLVHYRILLRDMAEIRLILIAMVIGTISDSIFAATGLIGYQGGYGSSQFIAPLWITGMWGGFAATLNHSLGWLKPRKWLAFALGAVSGPMSYLAGVKLGVLAFSLSTPVTLLLLGAFWGSAVPLLIGIQEWQENRRTA